MFLKERFNVQPRILNKNSFVYKVCSWITQIADNAMFIKNFVMGHYETHNFQFIQSIKVAFGCFNKIYLHYCNAQEI